MFFGIFERRPRMESEEYVDPKLFSKDMVPFKEWTEIRNHVTSRRPEKNSGAEDHRVDEMVTTVILIRKALSLPFDKLITTCPEGGVEFESEGVDYFVSGYFGMYDGSSSITIKSPDVDKTGHMARVLMDAARELVSGYRLMEDESKRLKRQNHCHY